MSITYLTISGGKPIAKAEQSVYDQDLTINSPTSSGTPVTLPASGNYNSGELFIWLNNVPLDPVNDYAYTGSIPRTQVTFTFNLIVGDILRFRKNLA